MEREMARRPSNPKDEGGAAKAASAATKDDDAQPPMEDRVRRRAYQIWEEEGWPDGRQGDHWSRAEREIAETGGPVPDPAPEEDRSRAVAPPKAGSRPGASAKLGGAPSAPAAGKPTRGRAK